MALAHYLIKPEVKIGIHFTILIDSNNLRPDVPTLEKILSCKFVSSGGSTAGCLSPRFKLCAFPVALTYFPWLSHRKSSSIALNVWDELVTHEFHTIPWSWTKFSLLGPSP